MYDSDPKKANRQPAAGQTQPDHLLDELTSIRALLDSEQRASTGTDVPVLDDVVGFAASFKAVDSAPAPALLDLDGIFCDGPGGEDHGDTEPASLSTRLAFPKFTLDVAVSDADGDAGMAQAHAPLAPSSPREALIQELVAEFLPRIEATLRERLKGLGDDALRTLKKPD